MQQVAGTSAIRVAVRVLRSAGSEDRRPGLRAHLLVTQLEAKGPFEHVPRLVIGVVHVQRAIHSHSPLPGSSHSTMANWASGPADAPAGKRRRKQPVEVRIALHRPYTNSRRLCG